MSDFRLMCPVCRSPSAMVEMLMRADPYKYRLVCGVCQHPIDGPVDFDQSQARAGLRAAHVRALDRKSAPLRYSNKGIV